MSLTPTYGLFREIVRCLITHFVLALELPVCLTISSKNDL